MSDPTSSALRARYDQYRTTFTKHGLTPLAFDMWLLSLRPRPVKMITDVQFDADYELREGWAND